MHMLKVMPALVAAFLPMGAANAVTNVFTYSSLVTSSGEANSVGPYDGLPVAFSLSYDVGIAPTEHNYSDPFVKTQMYRDTPVAVSVNGPFGKMTGSANLIRGIYYSPTEIICSPNKSIGCTPAALADNYYFSGFVYTKGESGFENGRRYQFDFDVSNLPGNLSASSSIKNTPTVYSFLEIVTRVGRDQPFRGFNVEYNAPVVTAPVPEPASWVMMILGMGVVGRAMRARSKSKFSHVSLKRGWGT